MLKLEHVKKKYENFQLDCSMEVKDGRITGLIGMNGAGKSTTFRGIMNLIALDGGAIEFMGEAYTELTREQKKQIGVVLAESTFSGYLTIRKILPVMSALYEKFEKEAFIQKCNQFGLPMNKKIMEFSTGMKAKFKMLLAMSYHAKFLLLDEPTAGLDVIARDELLDELREYAESNDASVLISSHISSDLENLCDDVYVIDSGKIQFHEEMPTLLDEYGILRMDSEHFAKMDKRYILCCKKERMGYQCLTNERAFYQENEPEIVVEKGNLDVIITMLVKGKKVEEMGDLA